MQPGETITPHQDQPTAAPQPELKVSHDPEPSPSEPVAPVVTSTPEPTKSAAQPIETQPPSGPAEAPTETDNNAWQYRPEDNSGAKSDIDSNLEPVSWSASEYIEHEKRFGWFMGLVAVATVAAAALFFITGDKASVAFVLIAAILFGIAAAHKPGTLQYNIDAHGIGIGKKFYPFSIFKSFSVLEEGAFSSIQLLPLKRFMPPLSIYYPPDHEASIVDLIGNYLPHEERQRDAVERLMRRVRF